MLSQNEIEKYTEEWIEQDSKMAFTKLFEHYRKQLTEYAKTLTGNVDDANDLVQDVFLKLFKMKVENKNGGKFYGYAFLKLILKNMFIDNVRKEKRRKIVPFKSIYLECITEVLKQKVSNEEAVKSFDTILKQLSNDQQRVILLRLKGLSTKKFQL